MYEFESELFPGKREVVGRREELLSQVRQTRATGSRAVV